MTTILQMSQEDLRAEIKNCLKESIQEIRSLPTPAPLPDRITLVEACQLTAQSKSQIYKLTMTGDIPFAKYGRKLVFSRKALLQWMDDRTISSSSASDQMTANLTDAAKKRLKKR